MIITIYSHSLKNKIGIKTAREGGKVLHDWLFIKKKLYLCAFGAETKKDAR